MTTKRRKFTNKFKAMVALAAIREPVHERAMGRSLREYYESQHGWSRTRKYENNKLLIRTHEAA